MRIRPFFFPIAALFLSFSQTSQAEVITAESRIQEVTVFADRALVTRSMKLNLSKGTYETQLEGLPGMMEESSLTAKGRGTASVQLFGAKLVRKQLAEPQDPRVKELQSKMNDLNYEIRGYQNRNAVINSKTAFIESIKAASSNQIAKDIVTRQPSVVDTKEILGLLSTELTAGHESQMANDKLIEAAQKEINRLQREVNEIHQRRSKTQVLISVDLESKKAGDFTLEVSYRLPGARWSPVYEARTASGETNVVLNTYGMVRQNTGEDWNDVKIHLSTAKPSVSGQMPEIQPWYVRKYEPPVVMLSRAAGAPQTMRVARSVLKERKRKNSPAKAEMFFDEVAREEMVMAQGTVSSQGPAVYFTLPRTETILADWQPRKVSILSQTLKAAFAYETTPKLSPRAYLRAKVTNETEGVLLAGPLQIFLDEAYIGNAQLKLVGPGETFDLFLGADERIRVKRKLLKQKKDISLLPRLQGRLIMIDYSYLTTIQNFTGKAIEITVYDQTPVSQHDEIKIEKVFYNPPPTKKDAEKPGVSIWNLNVGDKQKQTITQTYQLKHPETFVVQM